MTDSANTENLSQVELSLGGLRVRLKSLEKMAPLTLATNDDHFKPFLDAVTNSTAIETPKADIEIILEPIVASEDWVKYLPKSDFKSRFIAPHQRWYYQQENDASSVFVVLETPLHEGVTNQDFIKILRINPDYTQAVLAYNAALQNIPLDPASLLGWPLDHLLIANRLMQGQGLILHASGVATPEGVMVFTGPSGAGKSTLCRLSQKFPQYKQLCDERIIIRLDPSSPTGFRAYGTPWPGEGNIYNRLDGPLGAIFLINHGPSNQLRPASDANALSWLMRELFPAMWDEAGLNFTLDFIMQLLEKIPCYYYGFIPTVDAIIEAHQAINSPT
jgi:hypothetical protein